MLIHVIFAIELIVNFSFFRKISHTCCFRLGDPYVDKRLRKIKQAVHVHN